MVSSTAATTTWIHCSVGPELEPGEEEETKVQVSLGVIQSFVHGLQMLLQKAQLKPLRGFDRLAAAGFSTEDIASIRAQFHANSSGDYIDEEFSSEADCEIDLFVPWWTYVILTQS